jgi:stage II sporulation protein D
MKRVTRLVSALIALGLAAPGAIAAVPAAASVAPAGSQLTIVPGPGVTLTVDGLPYSGDIVVAPGAGGVDVVNHVGFEQYVEGISEMPSNWPAAALQAQAVAARTYALWTVLTHPAGPGGGQICASDSCQVYRGLAKPQGPYGSNWVAAVRATTGAVLQYQSRIIESLYGSSDGGQTLYGGVPWLPAVDDPQDAIAPEHAWSWSAPLSTFASALKVPAGLTLVSLVSSSRAITETLQDSAGQRSTKGLTPDDFHSLVNANMANPPKLDLPLPSYRYSVSTNGNQVEITGSGDGDGLGMSQYGALGKAEDGWSAGQILGTYYHDTTAAALPAGEMPATIGVILHSGAASAEIGADGPVTVSGPTGATLAHTTGAAGWIASPSSTGVTLSPGAAGGASQTAQAEAADTAPVPQRATPPVSLAPVARPSPPAATTTTTAPDREALAIAATVTGRTAGPARRVPFWPGALAGALLTAVIAALLKSRKILVSRRQEKARIAGGRPEQLRTLQQ